MEDKENQQVISSYKVGFLNKLEITDTGIRDRALDIPYSLIKECYCSRNISKVPDRCVVKYIDKSELEKRVEFGGNAIEVYSDIMRSSIRYEHRILPKPSLQISQLADQLRQYGTEAELIEPEVEHNKQDESSWRLGLGGIRLRSTNVETVGFHEEGVINRVPGAVGFDGSGEVRIRYFMDCTIRVKPIPMAPVTGSPVKKFLGRVVDYYWRNNKLAQRLNEDTKLRSMLVKSKAPEIEVRGNHIRIQDKKFPSAKLFQCIDRIAGHIHQEAS